mmetsp:Transcript_10250/g.12437  ORF Transcript_10250/g.12437 Transcript_10250/m.12437 type:complete len:247 (+) Transcript_10250:50-790(+)
MFDPNSLANSRASQAAVRRITQWANSALEPLAATLPDATARLSVREVKCVDPECITPEGVEVLITLTAEGWSVTAKILKSAKSCTEEEIIASIQDLCKGAKPRALAAHARRIIELKSSSVPMNIESFTVRVLTRIFDDFPVNDDNENQESRIAALRMLQESIKLELGESLEDSPVEASEPTPPPPKTIPEVKRSKPAPTLQMSSGRLQQNDGDEANEMMKHRGGGLNCPCCNPDNPEFLVDKMLMM